MGTVIHRTVIITGLEDEYLDTEYLDEDEGYRQLGLSSRVADLKKRLPSHLRHLFIGPFRTGVNATVQYIFLTSGSNLGRDLNMEHAMFCNFILETFRNEAILVTHGETEPTVMSLRGQPKGGGG